MNRSSLDPIWWLIVPLLVMVIQIALEITLPGEILGTLHSEWGPHETLQFVVIALAFLVSGSALLRINWGQQKLLGIWIVLAAAGSLYVAGEEISWGQHVFGWGTSEYWQAINDQGETNLHNTSSWLDQKPRLILFVGIVVGGLIIPGLKNLKPEMLPSQFSMLYPDWRLSIVSALVLLPYIVQKIAMALGVDTFARVSEVQELYMYYFILLYLWEVRSRELPPHRG